MDKTPGKLYVVSTPIGNLEDVTFRAIRVLKEVDLIAAEDTRRIQKLLNRYDIRNEITSYFDHNKEKKTPSIVERLLNGDSVAVVSDAGTPGISDPAFYLVRESIARGIQVIPIPGASAVISALVCSGLPTDRFCFEGFLPRKKGRKKRIQELREEPRTIILYESPHRLLRTLSDLKESFGEREVVIARELTKIYEEFHRGKISGLEAYFKSHPVKGEFVILIHGKK